ncbi:hypothetical protein ACRALDRAFT_209423 [Sodiomyces alcalophilus JCM 7366]|uniref:uncharacterized protein n=1 Tax=Sodiomyces alcalophilus JCM 7366 TaxID=591952 RepID=UPI0039B37D6A
MGLTTLVVSLRLLWLCVNGCNQSPLLNWSLVLRIVGKVREVYVVRPHLYQVVVDKAKHSSQKSASQSQTGPATVYMYLYIYYYPKKSSHMPCRPHVPDTRGSVTRVCWTTLENWRQGNFAEFPFTYAPNL